MRTWWQRYWFPDGGRCNAGVARIAVAASTLLMLGRLRDHALIVAPDQAPVASYDPVGVLMLLPGAPPPAALVTAAYAVAWLASAALLHGAWTRVAAALSPAAALVVVSFAVSLTPDWPHYNNLPLLALVAVQGTRGGDVLGLDGCRRRRRGLPPPPADGYEWKTQVLDWAWNMQIDLNEYGFCKTDKFEPLDTSRPGVFVAGAFATPKEIAETVMDASGAAARCMALLSGKSGTEIQKPLYPPEKEVSGESPRVGVFVCTQNMYYGSNQF